MPPRSYSNSTRRRRPGPAAEVGMATSERLELGLLVGRDHVVVCAKCFAVEDPLVEVEEQRGLLGEVRVAREAPRAITPGLDRRRRQPAAHRRRRDRLDEPFAPRLGRQLVRAPARQRNVTSLGWLAGQRLDPRHHRGAETPRPSRARTVSQTSKSLFTKALAPLRRHVDTDPNAPGDVHVLRTIGRRQHDASSNYLAVRGPPRRCPFLEHGTVRWWRAELGRANDETSANRPPHRTR